MCRTPAGLFALQPPHGASQSCGGALSKDRTGLVIAWCPFTISKPTNALEHFLQLPVTCPVAPMLQMLVPDPLPNLPVPQKKAKQDITSTNTHTHCQYFLTLLYRCLYIRQATNAVSSQETLHLSRFYAYALAHAHKVTEIAVCHSQLGFIHAVF